MTALTGERGLILILSLDISPWLFNVLHLTSDVLCDMIAFGKNLAECLVRVCGLSTESDRCLVQDQVIPRRS